MLNLLDLVEVMHGHGSDWSSSVEARYKVLSVSLPAQFPYLCVPGNVLSGHSSRSFCTASSL